METILISACLTGYRCKYNGGSNELPGDVLKALRKRYELLPVCPEQMGGLPTPRVPAERRGEQVVTRDGRDVTEAFRAGASKVLKLAKDHAVRLAVLKSRSPSCGRDAIYDGTFSGTLTEGNGVTAELLQRNGIRVMDENEITDLI